MEDEYFISCYCRTLDDSRMVTVETDGTRVTDVDCCYGSCPHAPNCEIAHRIRQIAEN